MAKQGYKRGGWEKKYVIRRVCTTCGGRGNRPGTYFGLERCTHCGGRGSRPVDKDAVYFVLRLDEDPHARTAALAYADSVESDNAQFAQDIRAKVPEAAKAEAMGI